MVTRGISGIGNDEKLEAYRGLAAEIAKHVVLTKFYAETADDFNKNFGKIYDFVLNKLCGK